jgi:hypothetical protein
MLDKQKQIWYNIREDKGWQPHPKKINKKEGNKKWQK